MRLRDEDGRAVDLLLNQASGKANGNGNGNGDTPAGGFVNAAPQPAALPERVTNAERLLKLLDLDVASEPPEDLIERTQRRIELAEEAAHTTGRPIAPGVAGIGLPPTTDAQRPHA